MKLAMLERAFPEAGAIQLDASGNEVLLVGNQGALPDLVDRNDVTETKSCRVRQIEFRIFSEHIPLRPVGTVGYEGSHNRGAAVARDWTAARLRGQRYQ